MLANNLIDIGSIIDALKQSGLITQLFQEFLNWGTLQTVAETAFAALAGECSGSSSGGSGTSTPSTGNGGSGSGSGSGSVTSNVGSADPCKKRRRVRRRRRSNY